MLINFLRLVLTILIIRRQYKDHTGVDFIKVNDGKADQLFYDLLIEYLKDKNI